MPEVSSWARGEEAEELLFGAAHDAAGDFQRRLWAARAEWPAFTVALAADHRIHVVYRTIADDPGTDYLLHHPDWDRAELLARDDGHFMGPGLSWPELVRAADQALPGGSTADPHARLLLLLPAFGGDEVPADSVGRLAAALRARRGVRHPERLATALLAAQGAPGPARWTTAGHGFRVNEGEYSWHIQGICRTLRLQPPGLVESPPDGEPIVDGMNSNSTDTPTEAPLPLTLTLRADATPTPPALLLRPWREEDTAALVEGHRGAPTDASVSAPAMRTEAEGLRWVRHQRKSWTTGARYAFAVLETERDGGEGRLLGHVVLKDAAHGRPTAEVGYWTAVPARGQGIAPRALETLTTWAFTTFAPTGLTHLQLLHQVTNPASCRVAEKTGYAFTAIVPASPPDYPADGHLHVRRADG
ncbi:GNAT family N-acetyltransferase [Streptomyces huasconensis]|uniref:GNAT family N-acetyltransferase n=1 Tax=Streptomyces huasconensis TaxID=1854574 RepID=A0ABV3LPS8_9ACTN